MAWEVVLYLISGAILGLLIHQAVMYGACYLFDSTTAESCVLFSIVILMLIVGFKFNFSLQQFFFTIQETDKSEYGFVAPLFVMVKYFGFVASAGLGIKSSHTYFFRSPM